MVEVSRADKKAETATERAARLLLEVDQSKTKKGQYTAGEVKAILQSISSTNGTAKDGTSPGSAEFGCRTPREVQALFRGDVFIGKVVGGKVRPWVVLRVNTLGVVAISMSHGDTAPGMAKAKCRYWGGAWIGTTISLFRHEGACREVMAPYSNLGHLAEIEARVLSAFRDEAGPKVESISEIRNRIAKARQG